MFICLYRRFSVENVLPKKIEILKGREGSQLWNSEGMGGGNAFWNFRRQGGVKTWKLSVFGYGYFLELPILQNPAKYDKRQPEIHLHSQAKILKKFAEIFQ